MIFYFLYANIYYVFFNKEVKMNFPSSNSKPIIDNTAEILKKLCFFLDEAVKKPNQIFIYQIGKQFGSLHRDTARKILEIANPTLASLKYPTSLDPLKSGYFLLKSLVKERIIKSMKGSDLLPLLTAAKRAQEIYCGTISSSEKEPENPVSQEKAISEHFTCSITQDIMKDPVIDIYGNSYERTAIMDWLSRNNTSPINRKPLTVDQLFPNRALKDTIEEFKKSASKPATETKSSVEEKEDSSQDKSNSNTIALNLAPNIRNIPNALKKEIALKLGLDWESLYYQSGMPTDYYMIVQSNWYFWGDENLDLDAEDLIRAFEAICKSFPNNSITWLQDVFKSIERNDLAYMLKDIHDLNDEYISSVLSGKLTELSYSEKFKISELLEDSWQLLDLPWFDSDYLQIIKGSFSTAQERSLEVLNTIIRKHSYKSITWLKNLFLKINRKDIALMLIAEHSPTKKEIFEDYKKLIVKRIQSL